MNKNIKSKLKKIAKEFDLNLLVLFGSYAKNQENSKSDLDLAYIPNKNINELDLISKIISEINIKKVDLININDENNSFILLFEIFNSGILIFEKDKNLFKILAENSYFNYIDSQFLRDTKSQVLSNKLNSMNVKNYKKTLTF